MKMTKSYKIVLLLTEYILVVTSMFCSLFFAPSSADETTSTNASTYFTGLSSSQVKFDGGYLVATVKEDSRIDEEKVDDEVTVTKHGILNVANKLAVNDLEMVFVIPSGLKSLTMVVDSTAYYANGNIVAEKVDGKYVQKVDTVVTNEIEFDFTANTAKVNGKDSKAFSLDGDKLVVSTSVNEDSYVEFVFGANGAKIATADIVDGETLVSCKKVKNVADVSVANVSFKFALKDAATPVDFKIESIDQKASDAEENYKQTFETDSNGVVTDKKVYPIVAINDSFYKNNADGTFSAIKNLMVKYTLTVSVYTPLNNVTASEVYVQKDDANIWVATGDNPKSLIFKKAGAASINLVAKDGDQEIVYKTVSGINVINFADDTTAPEYVYSEQAYQTYLVALKQAYYNVEDEHYTALGSNMTIPSLKDLVFDDIETYENLNKTVYYDTNSSEDLSASGMSISLSEAGKYVFNVVVSDDNGNVMNKDKDFEKGAKYEKFVFSFDVVDDAPISITEAPVQGAGVVGVKYTASKFDIDAVGCNTTYTLYYNANGSANADDEGWVVVPKASTVTDTEYDKDGYTYDEIQSIGYDGSLTFTPDAKGSYKIECVAVSSVTSRSDSAATIIRVDREISPVKVYTDWLANNVWSVVFLSIGTLCLIAIIVLLCIKPKDELESDK